MRVLFHQIRDESKLTTWGHRQDYQSDSLYHGLRQLLGSECVDSPKMEHMYRGEPLEKLKTDKTKGFTLYGRLDDIPVDREELGGFDLVVCSIHHSAQYNHQLILDSLQEIRKLYRPERVAIVDGADDQGVFESVRQYGVLFKRELSDANQYRGVRPINFAVPEENFVKEVPTKDRDFAPLIPCYFGRGTPAAESTYIYTDEEHYNNDYRRSRFGFTCIKGGADTLRHYEQICNGCVPYFSDIELVPQYTLMSMPKGSLKFIKDEMVRINGITEEQQKQPFKPWNVQLGGHKMICSEDDYREVATRLLEYGRIHLTTKALARYVLEEMSCPI